MNMDMEMISVSSVVGSVILIILISWGWRLLNWVWFKPKKLEKQLRQQGLQGKAYRFFHGDLKETVELMVQARSNTAAFGLSDDVALRVHPFLVQHIGNYGKNSFIWHGPTPKVIIMNPQEIKEVLTKPNEFKRLYVNHLAKLLSPGIANLNGEEWSKHRKIINPAFHQEKLKVMLPHFYESCKEMIEKWEKLIGTKESYELDVWPHLQNLTCDIIARAAFGSNHEEGKLIFDLLKDLTPLVVQALLSTNIPGWRFLPTKSNRRMKEIDRKIKASLFTIINKRERAVKAGEEGSPKDLLGLLIESNLLEMKESGDKKNVGLTTKEVMDECRLFYFAGHESTSDLLVWTMILLAKYSHWQSLAREEVFQVFGNHKPDFDGLNRLKFVTMILYEVLRLYPPVIGLDLTVVNETRLGNLRLPAGIMVSLPLILIHKEVEIWGNDASEFNPARFSDGILKATNNHQVGFFPFSYGPRTCIGQNFALAEVKMVLAMILQHFSFHLSPSYTHGPCTVATLQPQYGAQLILHKLVKT